MSVIDNQSEKSTNTAASQRKRQGKAVNILNFECRVSYRLCTPFRHQARGAVEQATSSLA